MYDARISPFGFSVFFKQQVMCHKEEEVVFLQETASMTDPISDASPREMLLVE